jgi:hypothetical protein
MNSMINYINSLNINLFKVVRFWLRLFDTMTLITDISEFAAGVSLWSFHRDMYNFGHNLGKLVKVGVQLIMIGRGFNLI